MIHDNLCWWLYFCFVAIVVFFFFFFETDYASEAGDAVSQTQLKDRRNPNETSNLHPYPKQPMSPKRSEVGSNNLSDGESLRSSK